MDRRRRIMGDPRLVRPFGRVSQFPGLSLLKKEKGRWRWAYEKGKQSQCIVLLGSERKKTQHHDMFSFLFFFFATRILHYTIPPIVPITSTIFPHNRHLDALHEPCISKPSPRHQRWTPESNTTDIVSQARPLDRSAPRYAVLLKHHS